MGQGGDPQDAESRPLLSLCCIQLVMIAYLTVCLSLSHRIRLYPLDFGVFSLFCS